MKKIKHKSKICNMCGKPILYPCQCVVVKNGKVLFNKIFVRYPWVKNEYYHINCARKVKKKIREGVD